MTASSRHIHLLWSFTGGLIAAGIVVNALFTDRWPGTVQRFLWLHAAALMMHQLEEYGWPGGFRDFFNDRISPVLFRGGARLTDSGVLAINVALAWPAYLAAAGYFRDALWLSAGLAGITILNGLLHVWMAVRLRAYNPGLVTGGFVFIPFGAFLLYMLWPDLDAGDLLPGLVVFAAGNVSIPAIIRLSSR